MEWKKKKILYPFDYLLIFERQRFDNTQQGESSKTTFRFWKNTEYRRENSLTAVVRHANRLGHFEGEAVLWGKIYVSRGPQLCPS